MAANKEPLETAGFLLPSVKSVAAITPSSPAPGSGAGPIKSKPQMAKHNRVSAASIPPWLSASVETSTSQSPGLKPKSNPTNTAPKTTPVLMTNQHPLVTISTHWPVMFIQSPLGDLSWMLYLLLLLLLILLVTLELRRRLRATRKRAARASYEKRLAHGASQRTQAG